MNHAREILRPTAMAPKTATGVQFNPALLKLLQCPLTHSSVEVAEPILVDRINDRIKRGGVVSQSGEPVDELCDAVLQNESKTWLIPVRGGIITLVADQLVSARFLED
jgi:hypothetical protein